MRVLTFLVVLTIGISCSKDEAEKKCTQAVSPTVWTSLDQTKLTADIKSIDDYITAHPPTVGVVVEDESGIRYDITEAGTGEKPCLESVVNVAYTGILLNGNKFDESTGAQFTLKSLIAGWQIAFLKFNKGTKATLYVPSGLAYGARAIGSIPANSNLIFFVELKDFQ